MKTDWRKLVMGALVTAGATLPVSLASAAGQPAAVPPALTVAKPDPMAPLPDAQPAAPVVAPVVPLPPLIWLPVDADALLRTIQAVGSEGLSPRDYDPAGLIAAMRSGDPMQLSQAATERFNKLSWDMALGHVRGDNRADWHVKDNDLDAGRQRLLLETALRSHRVSEALTGLLPTHPQYGALRVALAAAAKTDTAKVNRIRLNMDRWRWLPRDLGDKYIIVNVPSFHATLVENGETRWKHRAIAGKVATPTPNLSVMATGVILNPWWEVPTSISKEVAGKSGYVSVKGKDGKIQRWRQPPGPNNALGQLKFVMRNPYAIYLHDTNARSRFNSDVRALSHGCVRTEHVLDLATELLGDDGGEWTPAKIQETLKSKKTVEANFVKPVPVHIVYFTAAALVDGTIINYTDLYKRDGKVIEALLNSEGSTPKAKPTQSAAR